MSKPPVGVPRKAFDLEGPWFTDGSGILKRSSAVLLLPAAHPCATHDSPKSRLRRDALHRRGMSGEDVFRQGLGSTDRSA